MERLDVSDQRAAAGRQLDGTLPPARTGAAALHQRSSVTIFDVRIANLPMTVVQTDGNDVEPVTVDEFRISVAETYDVIVRPQDASVFTIFAQSMDRTGYARATLAPQSSMNAPVPPMGSPPAAHDGGHGNGKVVGHGNGKHEGNEHEQ